MRRYRLFSLLTTLAVSCFSAPSQAADDGSRYAAIWEKTSGPAWVARHGMSSQTYQQEFDSWASQGYCLSLVSGYSVANEARYAAIWEKKNCNCPGSLGCVMPSGEN